MPQQRDAACLLGNSVLCSFVSEANSSPIQTDVIRSLTLLSASTRLESVYALAVYSLWM